LIAATDRGLCAVRLGHDDNSLAAELRAEFPHAALSRDDAALSEAASIVSDLAAGRRRREAETLPLDVHATAFRRRVWEELRRIPFGETRSYGQIAAAVGAPGAARAVGTACATNPVAVVVPCHRVVASDGSLGGYAYGLARKRQLLDAEAGGAEPPPSQRPHPRPLGSHSLATSGGDMAIEASRPIGTQDAASSSAVRPTADMVSALLGHRRLTHPATGSDRSNARLTTLLFFVLAGIVAIAGAVVYPRPAVAR